MIGKTIGKYRFVDKLGKGGMGTVYRAVDETLDREVAVKVLNPDLADETVMTRFRAEATTLAKLNHPEIATIFEIYRSDSDLLMVMELVRGETLDQLSQRCGPLPPERAAYLVAQVLGALEHAHRAGIVHRDLKPANVMVTESGGVKIMDFGIARVVGAEHLTSDGTMMGTPAYMAPEQVMAKDVDGRADLYSAGVVFYRLLTGTLPFQADTAIGMVQKQLSDMPTPVQSRRADLPDWCGTILERALAKSPADRFQTAEEFRSALLAAISGATEHTGAYSAAHLPGVVPPPTAATPARGVTPPPTARVSPPPPAAATPAAPAATSEPATIILKKNHFAIAGALLAVLAIGVAVLAFVAIRRSTLPAAATASTLTSAAPDPAGAAPAATTPALEPPTPASRPPAAAAPVSAAAAPATAQTTRADSATAAKPPHEPATVPAVLSKPAAEPPHASRKDAASAAASLPPFVFDAKAVVADGAKNRERDTKVLLADGNVTVTEKSDRVVAALKFGSLSGISYSNSKQPMWNSTEGPAEVLKVEGGAFGFLKGGRNWVTLQTKETSLVLRVRDEDLQHVLQALEERTGHKVDRVVERKDH